MVTSVKEKGHSQDENHQEKCEGVDRSGTPADMFWMPMVSSASVLAYEYGGQRVSS